MTRPVFLNGFGLTNTLLCVLWLLAVICGLVILWNYGARPGQQSNQPEQWPADSTIEISGERPVVLFFAHPHCPCTRASLSELERVVAHATQPADFVLVALDPEADCEAWRDSDLVAAAARIPGVRIAWDPEGREANRFAVRTSGHVVAYASNGRAGFSGGITAARGHEGSSRGRSELIAWLRLDPLTQNTSAGQQTFPVFGCALMEKNDE